MKFKSPKQNTNFWIIVGTVAFFIGFYFIYMKSYVPNQESRIISTRFRVLDQLGDNINAKINSYKDNVRTLEFIIKNKVDSTNNVLIANNYFLPRESLYAYVYKTLTKGQFQPLNKDLEIFGYILDMGGGEAADNPAYQKNNEQEKTDTDDFFYFNQLPINIADENNAVFVDSILVRVKYESILNGLNREDVFDEMFIIRNGEFVFSTMKADMLIEKSGGDQGILELLFNYPEADKAENSKETAKPGPILSLPDRLVSGQFSNITISNKNYKLFFKPVKVEGEYWFLGGLMEVENFYATGRSIPQRVIIFLGLLLILLILGMPLIKLKVIAKTEHLKAMTIPNSALAVLLSSSVITLFLLYLSQNSLRLKNADQRLINLSAAIDSTFTGEITNAFNQLEAMDMQYLSYSAKLIPDILNLDTDNPARPNIYPFADYIFWANKKGMQSVMLSPFRDKKSEFLDLKKREYFRNKDEWFFPPDLSKKFRMESIFSIRSGDHKVALSTTSNSNNPVIALTSRFYSLIDPIMPKNYGYCIIDEKGEVWFHSDKYRNLMENFVEECNKEADLKAALYSKNSTSVDVYYYNKPHRAFIKPLDQLPLYLVTFYNWNAETSFQSEVFTMSLILVSLFFMFIVIQLAIILILERRFQGKLTQDLIMNFTRPLAHLQDHYRFLFRVYLVVVIATAIWISFFGKIQAYMTIYMVEVIIFTFSYMVLNDNDLKKTSAKWFAGINLFILTLMNAFLFVSSDNVTAFITLGYQLLLILTLIWAYHSFKGKSRNSGLPFTQVFIRNYVMFILLIAIMFAVLPTMVFYEIAYNYESEIRLRHYQVDLMKKREVRNALWNNYYAPMITDSRSASIITLQDRKNKGIYTNFLHGMAFSQVPLPPAENEKDVIQGSVYDSFFLSLRPYYDDDIVENRFLISGIQDESRKYWINYGRDSLVLKYLSNTEDAKFKKQDTIRIAGQLENFNFLMPYRQKEFSDMKASVNNTLFWLIMLVFIFIIYQLTRFGVRKIFCLDIVANFSHQPFDEMLRQQFLNNKDIFITKLSPKDDIKVLTDNMPIDLQLDWSDKEIISNSEVLIETAMTGDTGNTGSITVLIDHFEWSYTKPEILNEKLETLLKFNRLKEIHLLIHSIENPSKIIAYYQEIIDLSKNAPPPDDKNPDAVDMTPYKKALTNLKSLMNHAVTIPMPVKCNYNGNNEKYPCVQPGKKPGLEDFIKEELDASDYLGQFKESLDAYYESMIRDHDREDPEAMIVNKINTLAGSYYEDLIGSCSPEEQYILIDAAKDEIMNQKSSTAIFGLLEKGILVKKCDKLSFMNVSFRKYLLAQKGKLDIADLEVKIGKKAGTWQGYKFMFILIIVSLFIFISMANQDFMKNLQQIFVVIGGGIAAITGVLGLLAKTGKPSG